MKLPILVVDDDAGVLSALCLLLKSEGYSATTADSPEAALILLKESTYSLILMDLNYSLDTTSGGEGIELISTIRGMDELTPIVVMTGWGSIDVAVKTMRLGANDFIQKPWDNERLLSILRNQIKLANSQIQSQKLKQRNQMLIEQMGSSSSDEIIAFSSAMSNTLNTFKQVAKSDVNVLLTGENGTGKSMFALQIHELSNRLEAPLISVNMGAVTESLFESEMFGHTKGAFTDAKNTRIGRFELADNGTLFLDEIANTPLSQQAKLLRVLESSQFEKIGSSKTQTVDIRLITATNSDLDTAVEQHLFRKDLLYRINTIQIEIPPLRDRQEDIIPLAEYFLEKYSNKYQRSNIVIGDSAKHELQNYLWPGNVRELSHVIERAIVLSQIKEIKPNDLGIIKEQMKESSKTHSENTAFIVEEGQLKLETIELNAIKARLDFFDGNAAKASKSLGLSRSSFYRRMDKLPEKS